MLPRSVSVPVLMLRHGQSHWNAARRWQGAADIALTGLGRGQAAGTAARLRDLGIGFAGAWSSTLVRASETAEIIADRLDLGSVTTDTRLREADAGEWQGLTIERIEAAYPGWLDARRRPDSFEPYPDVVARAEAAIADIATALAGNVGDSRPAGGALVVAHSGLIRSLIRSRGRDDHRIPNLGGVWFDVTVPASAIAGHDDDPSVADSHGDGHRPPVDIAIDDLFDPGDIVVSGIDMPGEDPSEKPDQPGAHRPTQR